ncbi:MAG: MBOAT family protein [Clostridia bacterium]|nr:MBOAT family protein [Clostridia bacterium]
MLFSSISFLYLFLPAVLLCVYALPRRTANYVLLAFSLAFYVWGERAYAVVILVSTLSGYLHSLAIDRWRRKKRLFLVSSICINLLLLGFFKYSDFFINVINETFKLQLPLLKLPLPLGISFFTFQIISYTMDIYRGDIQADRSLPRFATYITLFPQLIAGPIVRYADVSGALKQKSRFNWENMALGARRFTIGLAKKALIANTLAELCRAFRASGEKTVLFYWLYALAWTLQIYFDFSGYSDMAIGLGRMFGFDFPENFRHPYASRSITEFWRRWHITLGGWFRDYVYIPMGGNRVSRWKWLRNIAVVWFLTGFWHGADWTFMVWGLFFGVLLAGEKLLWGKLVQRTGRVAQHIYVALIVLFGMVLFNGQGLHGAFADLGGMIGAGGIPLVGREALYYLRNFGVVLAVAVAGSLPIYTLFKNQKWRALEPVFVGALLVVSTASLVNGSFNPFLYFRF